MKKVFSVLAVAAILFAANSANAQIGVYAGYTPLTMTSTYTYNGNTSTDNSEFTSFAVGANYNVELPAGLGLSLGLQARYATSSDSVDLFVAKVKATQTQMLLDVPVLLNYGITLGRDARLSAFAGPMFTYALSGKTTTDANTVIGNGSNESDWYGDNSDMNRFNLSGAAGVCFTYNGLRLFGGYQMGFLNLTKAENTTLKTSGIFFGLGYAL